MADPARNTVYLVGGPCDGLTRKLTDDQLHAGTLLCKGKRYNMIEPLTLKEPEGIVEWGFQWKSGTSPPSLSAPHALGGWKALRKSINRGMPAALGYSQRTTTATLRQLARARKVRI